MRRYTLTVGLWLALLLLAACSTSEESPAEAQDPQPTQAVASQSTPDLAASAVPTDTSTPAEPTAEPAIESQESATPAGQQTEPATALPATAEPQPTATAAPPFNGEYEGTFYRGLATAPITMIDYSDFL